MAFCPIDWVHKTAGDFPNLSRFLPFSPHAYARSRCGSFPLSMSPATEERGLEHDASEDAPPLSA
jgi:hypothetical protein